MIAASPYPNTTRCRLATVFRISALLTHSDSSASRSNVSRGLGSTTGLRMRSSLDGPVVRYHQIPNTIARQSIPSTMRSAQGDSARRANRRRSSPASVGAGRPCATTVSCGIRGADTGLFGSVLAGSVFAGSVGEDAAGVIAALLGLGGVDLDLHTPVPGVILR